MSAPGGYTGSLGRGRVTLETPPGQANHRVAVPWRQRIEVCVRRSVLVAVLLVSVGCKGTPAQSQTPAAAAAGKAGSATAQPGGQPAGPGQPGAPGAPAAPPPVKPVPATLPDVLARIGTEAISKTEFETAVSKIEQRAGQPVPVEQRDQIYRRILDQ